MAVKGEKGSPVVYANTISRTEIDETTGEETERDIPFMKAYTVFNVERVDGLPAHFYATAEPQLDPVQRIDHAEEFFAATGADIRHGGNQAYYTVAHDYVQMPPFEAFRDAESYYATFAHECTHYAAARIMPHGRRRRSDFCGSAMRRFGTIVAWDKAALRCHVASTTIASGEAG